jgi:hypothetical protein
MEKDSTGNGNAINYSINNKTRLRLSHRHQECDPSTFNNGTEMLLIIASATIPEIIQQTPRL